jgi:hypothetical protein
MEQAEIVASLHRLADAVGEQMTQWAGNFVCLKIGLKSPDAEGNRLRLVCGVETVGDDESE